MRLFRRKHNQTSKQDRTSENQSAISKACGINNNNLTVMDYYVYGIVHYPLEVKNDYEYLSANSVMLIDETIIAYKLAKYRLERYLFLHDLTDNQFMLDVAERVRKAICILYNCQEDLIKDQWSNRCRSIKLVYLTNEEKQYPDFFKTSKAILTQDYALKEYSLYSVDSPVPIIDFNIDMLLHAELKSFITSFHRIVDEMNSRLSL